MKRTILDHVLVVGNLAQIRLAKQDVEGDEVISSQWHRTAVPVNGDVDLQMEHTNAHLVSMGEEPVGPEEIAKIKERIQTA